MALISAFGDSNAAPSKADKMPEEDSPYKCGYSVVEAAPDVPELQSQVPGQGEAIGAVQAGTAIKSYSLQSPTLSSTSGMPASKK
jgi:hypothetical protein